MNFQKIPPIGSEKDLLDLAFRKARERGQLRDLSGNWLQIIRTKETLKLDVIKDSLVTKLDAMMQAFPVTKDLSSFYIELMKLTLDYEAYKKSLGALYWAMGKIRFFHSDYIRKIIKCADRGVISGLSKEFYGRISSVLRQISPNLDCLAECRRVMRTYPDVKEMFTVCLYGFHNVGKSTLLNKLTGSRAEVAAYAFTTKSINSGFMMVDLQKIQVLDVPGTLARADKMNLIELQAELVVRELADVIVFVADVSGTSGHLLPEQQALLRHLGIRKPVLLYLSKTDLVESVDLAGWKQKPLSLEEIKAAVRE